MTMNSQKQWMTIPQVADYLGFSPGAVRRWVRRRVIPYDTIGGAIRFDMEQINQWLEDETVKHLQR